jgi:hypothetical protein
MAYQFEQDPKWFGAYPYNLDLLTQLVYMPYPQLKRDVLSYLPSYMQTDLDGRLSKESVQSRHGLPICHTNFHVTKS